MDDYERLEEIGKGNLTLGTHYLFRKLRFRVQDPEEARREDPCLEGDGLPTHEGERTAVDRK